MGLNHITIAAMIAMLGGAPALHAETADQADDMAAAEAGPAPSDPALDASPIAGTEPVVHPADVVDAPETPEPPPAPADRGHGDTLVMPTTPPAGSEKPSSPVPDKVEADNMPKRGASMAQVLKIFGQPREKLPPVGDPPITRWNYGDYTVYFEREYVIHSVVNTPQTEPAPVPPTPSDTPATAPQPADGE
ncbi:MAG TPA: hypothetical protein VGE50_05010 [Gammaproteobacteria bacterium]